MKIAIYKNKDTYLNIEKSRYFDKIVHIDHIAKLKGLKSGPDDMLLGVYCFDLTTLDNHMMHNLSCGYKTSMRFTIGHCEGVVIPQ